ncbi:MULTISPECIES: hypothetical protein [unclassified Thioalkalivibrio]|uniref:hypothetical protein n=1 Tax=unclassified Thioalkalivibrio TaxID=2621013 RepID=UPI00039D3A74|nr:MULTISPECIES: hypothetical protein [unclassified Thioalkalivibrio]
MAALSVPAAALSSICIRRGDSPPSTDLFKCNLAMLWLTLVRLFIDKPCHIAFPGA